MSTSRDMNQARRDLIEGMRQFLSLLKREDSLPCPEEISPTRVILFHHLFRAADLDFKPFPLEEQYPLPELITGPLKKTNFDLREALGAMAASIAEISHQDYLHEERVLRYAEIKAACPAGKALGSSL